MKYILSCFEELGLEPEALDGIFISHEHSDHIRGAGALSRKFGIPIWSNSGTWSAAKIKLGNVKHHKEFKTEQPIMFNDLEILPIPISHDAAEPVCFRIKQLDTMVQAGIITDIGILTPPVKHYLFNSNILMLESNYDLDMLVNGTYPENVKLFILGELGHLSNTEAGESIIELIGNNTEQVLLSHISQDNNTPELAYDTVAKIIKRLGISETILGLTYHNRMSRVFELSE
jgi:phosphoribosyl 1,2-cyclic phosphodiesterase